MSIESGLKIGEVIARWLDPQRKEKAILRQAIAVSEELGQIYRKMLGRKRNVGQYSDWSKTRLLQWERHYRKQFEAWKDGKG